MRVTAADDPRYSRELSPGDTVVVVDPEFFRPADVELLLGDPSKARKKLGWEPLITFGGLVDDMVAYDLLAARSTRSREGDTIG